MDLYHQCNDLYWSVVAFVDPAMKYIRLKTILTIPFQVLVCNLKDWKDTHLHSNKSCIPVYCAHCSHSVDLCSKVLFMITSDSAFNSFTLVCLKTFSKSCLSCPCTATLSLLQKMRLIRSKWKIVVSVSYVWFYDSDAISEFMIFWTL